MVIAVGVIFSEDLSYLITPRLIQSREKESAECKLVQF